MTEFTFRLHPVGELVLGGIVVHPVEHAREVLRFWREWAASAPDDVCTLAAFLYAPPEPFVPPEVQGTPIVGYTATTTLSGAAQTTFTQEADKEKAKVQTELDGKSYLKAYPVLGIGLQVKF